MNTGLTGRAAILRWYNNSISVGPALAALSEGGRRGLKVVINSPVMLPAHPKRIAGVLRNYHGCCVQVRQRYMGMVAVASAGDADIEYLPRFEITLEYNW